MLQADRASGSELFAGQVQAQSILQGIARGEGKIFAEFVRNGEVFDRDDISNLFVNQGRTYSVGAGLIGVTAITNWRLILLGASPTVAAGDTYATHGGWTEFTNYVEATRPQWVGVAGSPGVVTNAASVGEFTIGTGGGTIGGAGMVGGGSAPTTKGDVAGGGTLWAAAAFGTGNRTLVVNDIIRITYQFTQNAG